MSKSTLTIRVRIGKTSRTFNTETSRAADFFGERLLAESIDLGASRSVARLAGLERRLNTAVSQELKNGMDFALRNLVGQVSPRPTTSTGQNGFKTIFFEQSDRSGSASTSYHLSTRGTRFAINARQFRSATAHEIHWRNLSGATRRRKTENQERFFLHTGALRSELRTLARTIIANTGVVKVQFLDENDRARPIGNGTGHITTNVRSATALGTQTRTIRRTEVPVGKLRITFLPNISPSMLPGLRSERISDFDTNMKFERRVGLSGLLLDKLTGPNIEGQQYHRPLLQPVFTFWTLFKLPSRVASALQALSGISAYGTELRV